MLARRERRATMQAAREAKTQKSPPSTTAEPETNSASWWASGPETPVEKPPKSTPRRSRFRRNSLSRASRQINKNDSAETRNDEQQEETARRARSLSRERRKSSPYRVGRGRSLQRIHSKENESGRDAADAGIISLRVDKRQKKIIYTQFSENPSEVMEIEVDETLPTPRDKNDVVVKVSASTVSYNDCMIRRGICFGVINPTGLPATPGMDVVGNIVAVGENVTNFKVGDRVAALVRTGGNARYINIPNTYLSEVPRSCDSAEAVCMVSTFMSAYQSIRLATNDTFLLEKKRVLITGGIEPVGQALIQLCFRAGAIEVYATAPDHRHRYIRTVLGAHPLPVDPKFWLNSVKESMDVVFDATCYDSLESTSASLNKDGVIVSLGMSALLNREKPGLLGAPLSAYWAKLKGQIMPRTIYYEVWDTFSSDRDAFKLDLEILFHLLKKRFIKPHIAKRVALSEVAEAQESLEKETARGAIVCLPWKRIVR